jgi:hypothetical protein
VDSKLRLVYDCEKERALKNKNDIRKECLGTKVKLTLLRPVDALFPKPYAASAQ